VPDMIGYSGTAELQKGKIRAVRGTSRCDLEKNGDWFDVLGKKQLHSSPIAGAGLNWRAAASRTVTRQSQRGR
jgi:hypothetical protein